MGSCTQLLQRNVCRLRLCACFRGGLGQFLPEHGQNNVAGGAQPVPSIARIDAGGTTAAARRQRAVFRASPAVSAGADQSSTPACSARQTKKRRRLAAAHFPVCTPSARSPASATPGAEDRTRCESRALARARQLASCPSLGVARRWLGLRLTAPTRPAQ